MDTTTLMWVISVKYSRYIYQLFVGFIGVDSLAVVVGIGAYANMLSSGVRSLKWQYGCQCLTQAVSHSGHMLFGILTGR